MVETVYHIPGAPRLALLADLHGRDPAPVIASLQRNKPSLICLAGDFIYGTWPEENMSPLETQINVLPFFRACSSIAPTFFSLGNHEQMLDEEDLETISATGVTVPDNTYTTMTIAGETVVLAGLTSAYVTDYRRAVEGIRTADNRYPKKESIEGLKGLQTASQRVPKVAWLSSFADVPGYHLLLSHHPSYIKYVPPSVQLVLSGHLHGSQWRYYSLRHREWRGVFNPDEGFFPTMSKGVYENRLVVSAGLSNTARIPRIFNPTEVVYVEP